MTELDLAAIEELEKKANECRNLTFGEPLSSPQSRYRWALLQAAPALIAAARRALELRAAIVFDVRATYPVRSALMSDDDVFAKWLDGVKERGWTSTSRSENG